MNKVLTGNSLDVLKTLFSFSGIHDFLPEHTRCSYALYRLCEHKSFRLYIRVLCYRTLSSYEAWVSLHLHALRFPLRLQLRGGQGLRKLCSYISGQSESLQVSVPTSLHSSIDEHTPLLSRTVAHHSPRHYLNQSTASRCWSYLLYSKTYLATYPNYTGVNHETQ